MSRQDAFTTAALLGTLLFPMLGAAQQSDEDPPAFDTLAMVEVLSRDFSPEQASSLVESFAAATAHLQTTEDAEQVRVNLMAQMAYTTATMTSQYSSLETQIAEAQSTIIMWLVGVALGAVGIVVATELRRPTKG